MMNKDTILKYLSDLMDADERLKFEHQLKHDPELKSEFEKISSSLNEFTNLGKIESESAYFNNLVPRVHEKVAENSKKGFIRFAPGFSFAVAALIILLLQLPKVNDSEIFKLEYSQNELTDIISETDDSLLADYLELGVVDDYNFYSYEDDGTFPDIYIDQSILSELGYDSENDFYDYGFSNNISDYSSEEANIIYDELINKKIL